MNPRSLLNIALALAVIAIAAAYYLRPQETKDASHALIPVPAEALRRIEIQRAQGPAIVLERVESTWRMTAPLAARLDEIALGRVLDIARLRTAPPLAGGDLARFELDKPWATIRFEQYVVAFGTTNPVTQELYLASGEHVHTAPARLAAAIPSVPAKLLAHRLFAADEVPVAIDFAKFSLRHDGTRWVLDPHDPGLSQDDLVRWVDQWRMASSVSTQPATENKMLDEVKVELRNGRAITLGVTQRTPDLVLVRRDESLAYHLPASLAATLLGPPNAPTAQSTGTP